MCLHRPNCGPSRNRSFPSLPVLKWFPAPQLHFHLQPTRTASDPLLLWLACLSPHLGPVVPPAPPVPNPAGLSDSGIQGGSWICSLALRKPTHQLALLFRCPSTGKRMPQLLRFRSLNFGQMGLHAKYTGIWGINYSS